MARYDGLIIPRSYSEYINKTDAATLSQALQLSGVMDAQPTENSVKPAKSGGIYNSLSGLETEISGKQDALTFDDVPTDGSENPVKSNGIYDALATKMNTADMNGYIDGLTELTQAEAADELIVYDVSASQSKKIKVKNLVGSYSTDETFTGKYWIDGKPIYRKVVDFGALPNNVSKTVAHGISGISSLTQAYGIIRNERLDYWLPLPFSSKTTTNAVSLSVVGSNIQITTGSDRTEETAIVILEYTKTS